MKLKPGVIIGIAGGILGAVFIAKSKSSGENGGGNGEIIMGTPTGQVVSVIGVGSGWSVAELQCQVENLNLVSVKKSFRFVYGGVSVPASGGRIWGLINEVNPGPEWLEVTLLPGEAINLFQPAQFIVPGLDPYIYGTIQNQPLFGPGEGSNFALEDDLGNLSPVIRLTRS